MPAPKKTLKINLLNREDFETSLAGQFLQWALSYGRYIIIITQIVVLSVFFLRFKLDRDHVDLKESVEQKQALISSVAEVEDQVRSIQQRLGYIKSIDNKQYTPLNILNFLQDVTPVNVSYQEIHIHQSDNSLAFVGTGQNLQGLSALLYQLKRSNKFSEITLDDIQRKPEGSVIFSVSTKFSVDSFKI